MHDTVLNTIIPYANCHSPHCQHVAKDLQLPHLDRLLAQWSMVEHATDEPTSYTLPHERAWARHQGLVHPDGQIPWAAWYQQGGAAPEGPASIATTPRPGASAPTDTAWAWVTPCHLHVGADHITMGDPDALGMDDLNSRELLDVLAPWLVQDGITLHYDRPTRWLASGAIFADMTTASLDRVQQRDVRTWMPSGGNTRTLQRLQSEMQMLLYTHPLNDARAEQGLAPINALWIHGAGALNAPHAATTQPLHMRTDLRTAALRDDGDAWAAAWRALDSGPIAQLLATPAGTTASLTLCGEAGYQRWENTRQPWGQRVQRQIRNLVQKQQPSLHRLGSL